jgi:hypothetical protein
MLAQFGGKGFLTMRVSSGNRLAPIPDLRGSVSDAKAGDGIRCRVVRRRTGDRPPGKPDWKKIPPKNTTSVREDEWAKLIEEHAFRDAVHDDAMSARSEGLLVDYISQRSPDRRRMYEILSGHYGDRLEAYSAGDGGNMRNANGMWEYDLTDAEARLVENFMEIYVPAFEAARHEYLTGRHLLRDV